ncbi:MAG TPA: FmdB family zinc ribbon protein [Solirubrobacterales bacterium]|nr:FmdB family zinc ribbon protein [Solirubrobacterales bacterium]
MPIYEYKCENGHVFEAIQKMTDEPLRECQECGAPASRVLSAPAIHFKGSGFHNTDYGKRKGGGNGGSSEGGSEPGSSKPDSGKSESKPKPDSKPAASTAD